MENSWNPDGQSNVNESNTTAEHLEGGSHPEREDNILNSTPKMESTTTIAGYERKINRRILIHKGQNNHDSGGKTSDFM